MKISIAMATYNGGRFLHEQLDSFVAQTRHPDELVVCDDGSSDETLQILESFSRMAPFEVRIYSNPVNLGYAGNFGKALSLCSGDIVFLSDQDDVWFPEKIERVTLRMETDEGAWLVFNDAEITDEGLHPTGLTMLGQILRGGLTTDTFVNGCCSAVSARLLPVVLPISCEEVAHDIWVHKLADLMDVRMVMSEVLQYYRRHDSNTSQSFASRTYKVSRWDRISQYAKGNAKLAAEQRLAMLERMSVRLVQTQRGIVDEVIWAKLTDAVRRLECERELVRDRLRLLGQPRYRRIVPASFFLLRGGYAVFSGWKSFARDILRL